MSADHAPHQACVAKVIESPFIAVTLACGVDQREIARPVGGGSRVVILREIERLYGQSDFFGEANTDKAACGNCVTVPYEARRFFCADDFSTVQCFHRRKGNSIWL